MRSFQKVFTNSSSVLSKNLTHQPWRASYKQRPFHSERVFQFTSWWGCINVQNSKRTSNGKHYARHAPAQFSNIAFFALLVLIVWTSLIKPHLLYPLSLWWGPHMYYVSSFGLIGSDHHMLQGSVLYDVIRLLELLGRVV